MRRLSVIALLSILLCMALVPGVALAETRTFKVDDQASLLTESERSKLKQDYTKLTEYIDVALATVSKNSSTTEKYASSYMQKTFGSGAAVVFVIDMDNREIYIYSNQAGLATISRADARAITDNIYKLASQGKYYECADAAFSQILTKCEGGRIARPVKHITNLLIAIVLGILVNFFYAVWARSKERSKARVPQGPQGASR